MKLSRAVDLRQRDWSADVRWGIGWGVAFSALYGVLVVAQYFASQGQVLERKGLHLLVVLAAYAASGVLGGAVLGILRPLGRSKGGSMLLGFIVMLPVGVMLQTAIRGLPPAWSGVDVASVILMASTMGPIAGWIAYSQTHA